VVLLSFEWADPGAILTDMAAVHPAITPELAAFICAQRIFFVATAPLAAAGRVNLSPKGLDTFRILAPDRVAYLDLTGSGNETSAHVAENGRITFMFCAFDGKPLILRLYGRGRVILPDAADWPEIAAQFPPHAGARQAILADITRVQTSCGFGLPLLEYRGERDALPRWAQSKGEPALDEYRRKHNARTIDGQPTPLGRTFSQEA
jgi:hypothetical protein